MNKETKKKVKLIVRTFLAANKGKSYTTRELCSFINGNTLGVCGGITPRQLRYILDSTFCWKYGIDRTSNRNVWEYKVGD